MLIDIKNEAENEQAITLLEQLMNLSERTPKQDAIYELLIVLIEKFEREFYKTTLENQPGSMLSFLIEQQDLQSI